MKRKVLLLLILCTLTMTLRAPYISGEENNTNLIDSFEKDMTNDGFQEYIRLQGDVLNNKSVFYQDVWLKVQNKFEKEWSISLQHGYDPNMTLVDLTGDKNPDIFYQVAKDEQLNHFHYQLYHFNQNKIQPIDLPNNQYTKVEFTNDFTLKLSTNPAKKPLMLDLSEKKDVYIEEDVYSRNGKPTGDNKPVIDQYGEMEPVLLSNSKGYGLKTSHHIHGINENDLVGKLQTVWYFEKNHWTNIKTEVVPDE